ncbi:SPFH domain-containing protein [Streptomyces sp. NPDC008313]|uniref:SPFH domain-containing protein n=1 Tax=Streptomyces sp. NPDC008313 TaxID=3364826 RepID=UPI0036E2434D
MDAPVFEGSDGASSRPRRADGAPDGGTRPAPARVIHTEATTEIPVHLLFRDEAGPVRVPAAPAVVGRRRGTGEQPRVAGPAPVRQGTAAGPGVELVERPARVLPGAAGVAAGACGVAGCALASWWAGVLPAALTQALALPGPAVGAALGPAQWAAYAGAAVLGLAGFGGLARGRTGRAWVLDLFGRYRGTVRRTGLMWVNPLLLRRRVDVRPRHWRSEPLAVCDANGIALRVVVLVAWRVKDTARAVLGVEDHEGYLRACVEAALSRVFSRLPADVPQGVDGRARAGRPGFAARTGLGSAAGGRAASLRDAEAVGDALTRQVAADAATAGLEVLSAQPISLDYAPEVATVMRRRRAAALDAQHRDTVLASVVDSVEDTVTRLTTRGLVALDDSERRALVRDLTVAFYAGRGGEAVRDEG